MLMANDIVLCLRTQRAYGGNYCAGDDDKDDIDVGSQACHEDECRMFQK